MSNIITEALLKFVNGYGALIVSLSLFLMVGVICFIVYKIFKLRGKAYNFILSDKKLKNVPILNNNEPIPPTADDTLDVLFAKLTIFHATAYTTKFCPLETVARFACDDARKSMDEQFDDRFMRPIANWNGLTLPMSLFATVAGLIGVVPHINDSNFGGLLATKLITTAIGLFVYALIEYFSVSLKNKYHHTVVEKFDDVLEHAKENIYKINAPSRP